MIMRPTLPGIKRLELHSCFSTAGWTMVLRLMLGFIQHWGSMSASAAGETIRTMGRHRANVIRFLARQKLLSDGWILNRAARNILKRELAGKRRGRREWLFVVDQTFVGHQSEKMENTFSRANYRPRQKHSNRRQLKYAKRSCHCFVCGLLLTPGGARIPCFRSYYTRDYCQQRQLKYRSQTELGAELIRQLPLPEGARVTVLGDTAFDAAVIRRACRERNYQWIVPLNPERVLEGPKPRPKVSSLAKNLAARDLAAVQLTPGKGDFAAHQRAARCRRGRNALTRTFYVHGERRTIRRLGEVLLVFSSKEKPQRGQNVKIHKLLVTNDFTLSAAEVVLRYDLRWQIELFFKELKSTLGIDHYRFREFEKVERWVALGLLTFLYLECQRQARLAGQLPPQQQRWWQAQRTHGLCRATTWQMEMDEFRFIKHSTQTPSGIRRLRRALKNSTTLEFRIAT
jgi:hypothetical protein